MFVSYLNLLFCLKYDKIMININNKYAFDYAELIRIALRANTDSCEL